MCSDFSADRQITSFEIWQKTGFNLRPWDASHAAPTTWGLPLINSKNYVIWLFPEFDRTTFTFYGDSQDAGVMEQFVRALNLQRGLV